MNIKSEQCYAFVTAVLYAVSYYIGCCYNKTDMYMIYIIIIILHGYFQVSLCIIFLVYTGKLCCIGHDTLTVITRITILNSSHPGQNGHCFSDNIFKCISLNEQAWIWIKIPLKFVAKGPINNITVLVQIMAWRRPGDKPLSEPMMTQFTGAYMRH